MVFILWTRSRPAPGGGAGKSMSNRGTVLLVGGAILFDEDDVIVVAFDELVVCGLLILWMSCWSRGSGGKRERCPLSLKV